MSMFSPCKQLSQNHPLPSERSTVAPDKQRPFALAQEHRQGQRQKLRQRLRLRSVLASSLLVLLCTTAATALAWVFRQLQFPETNIVVIYILSVLLIARFTRGYFYGIVGTILATATFNYFFTEPFFTLRVNDPSYIMTFIIMTLTSIITSALTSKVKQNALEAAAKEAETSALLQLSNHLTDARDLEHMASIAVATVSQVVGCKAACVCFTPSGQAEPSFIQQKTADEQIRRKLEDGAELRHRMENLRTPYDCGSEFCDWPIYGQKDILGVLRLPCPAAERLTATQLRLLRSLIENTALAMDRYRSVQSSIASKEAIAQERYRSNLLRAISHDLRTPLAGIMGTSEMLMSLHSTDSTSYTLAEGIYQDANWLHALVENILSLTRLRDGKFALNKQVEAVEEVIATTLRALSKRAPQREIQLRLPAELLLVPMDGKLIEQVLLNLLDNACQHSAPTAEILLQVSLSADQRSALFTLSDRGHGIDPQDLPQLFQMFYTSKAQGADAQRGVGLGLAICESIVAAHGGSICARNRSDGPGAEFSFTLPLAAASSEQAEGESK